MNWCCFFRHVFLNMCGDWWSPRSPCLLPRLLKLAELKVCWHTRGLVWVRVHQTSARSTFVKSLLVTSQAAIALLSHNLPCYALQIQFFSMPFSILLLPSSKEKSFYAWINSNATNYDQELIPSVEMKHWNDFNFSIFVACENNLEMSQTRK